MFEEPAMFKPLSYSSEFVSICHFNCFQLITQASRQKTYEQAVQIYLCQCIRQVTFIQIMDYTLKNQMEGETSGMVKP